MRPSRITPARPASKAVADYLAAQLKDWGLDVHIEEFEALMPYPTSRVLEMTAPVKFRAELKEPAIAEDPGTSEPGQLPTYNAYSASGDVTAPLVYVNYGLAEDYEELRREGVDVRGKIVIARYGRSWRGVKAKLAQENGAVGCLIYSDPREDGYFQGDVYPKGPMRPEQGVQRGSVLDMALYPGDPLSPGWAVGAGGETPVRWRKPRRCSRFRCCRFPMATPSRCSNRLGGPVVPESWRGALPITYHAGPGPATVHLKVDFDWTTKPLHDVIATIPGSVGKRPMDRLWQSSRRLGQRGVAIRPAARRCCSKPRARWRCCASKAGSPSGPSCWRCGTARSSG